MHPATGRVRRGALVCALAMICSGAGVLGVPTRAGAAETRERTSHEMGSQIRKHESGDLNVRPKSAEPSVEGMDVSGHQDRVGWRFWWNQGKRFAYVKATEGTGYVSPDFGHQYNGAHAVGMIRGAYHFALPNVSTGAAQARYFVAHGGGWVPDGRTLPGAVDLEYNPYGPTCYGLSKPRMTAWIRDFSDTYETLTGRHPTIYTSTSWWNTCTGGDSSFAASNPLWVARYGPDVGALPAGWAYQTVWQYDDHGRLPGDQNTFNGTVAQLRQFAA